MNEELVKLDVEKGGFEQMMRIVWYVCMWCLCVRERDKDRDRGREECKGRTEKKRKGKERRNRVLCTLLNSSAFLLSYYSLICSHSIGLFPSFYFLTSQGCA